MIEKLCCICLVRDVRLIPFIESEPKLFIENIFRSKGFHQVLMENPTICYECQALLVKTFKFVQKALAAQQILHDMYTELKEITLNQIEDKRQEAGLISKLSIQSIHINFSTIENQKATPQVNDVENDVQNYLQQNERNKGITIVNHVECEAKDELQKSECDEYITNVNVVISEAEDELQDNDCKKYFLEINNVQREVNDGVNKNESENLITEMNVVKSEDIDALQEKECVNYITEINELEREAKDTLEENECKLEINSVPAADPLYYTQIGNELVGVLYDPDLIDIPDTAKSDGEDSDCEEVDKLDLKPVNEDNIVSTITIDDSSSDDNTNVTRSRNTKNRRECYRSEMQMKNKSKRKKSHLKENERKQNKRQKKESQPTVRKYKRGPYVPSTFILNLPSFANKKRQRNVVKYANSDDSDSSISKRLKKNLKMNEPFDREFKPEYSSDSFDSMYEDYDDTGLRITKSDMREYPMQCDHCVAEIPEKRVHYYHYMNAHPHIPYPYPSKNLRVLCQFCGQTSRTYKQNKAHELTHGSKKNFFCDKCHKAFKNKIQLNNHTLNRHSNKLLQCDYCGKQFKTRGEIVLHIRIHTGEKPFKCHICGAGFAHKGNIKIHIHSKHQGTSYKPKSSKKIQKQESTCSTIEEEDEDQPLILIKKQKSTKANTINAKDKSKESKLTKKSKRKLAKKSKPLLDEQSIESNKLGLAEI